jgi:hypothetical protein
MWTKSGRLDLGFGQLLESFSCLFAQKMAKKTPLKKRQKGDKLAEMSCHKTVKIGEIVKLSVVKNSKSK